jgi:serine/threonine protein kinase
VAKALSAIHAAGAVHRDLKPENVLITEDHEIKVMDLGVARLADEQVRLSQTGAFVGSLHYAAPEQFGGGADVDSRADLHGLGLLLYEIATGTNPFADEDARVVMRRILSEPPRKAGELNPQLSPFFEELVAQLLTKDAAGRFDSADDVLSILDEAEQSAWWRDCALQLRTTTHRPLRRIRIPRETAVYGRDAELAQLRALYETANSGDGRVLLIEGEAGIGKTRLVDEFVSRLQQDGEEVNFLFASYPPGGAATAAGAFSAWRSCFRRPPHSCRRSPRCCEATSPPRGRIR